MSKEAFMEYALERLRLKRIKKNRLKNDIIAVKQDGWKRNGFKVGEI